MAGTVISAMDAIDRLIHAELVQGIVLPEDVRAFIHPRLDVVVVIYRSPDEVAEADAIQAERRKQC